MTENQKTRAAISSLMNKLQQIQDGKINADMLSSPLEQIQFAMLEAMLEQEKYILEHPMYEVESVDVELYGLAFGDAGDIFMGTFENSSTVVDSSTPLFISQG